MNKVVVWLLIFTLTPLPGWADPGPDQQHIESVKKKINACVDQPRRVVVETYDNRRLQGVITEAGTTQFVLGYAGRATTLSYGDVRKIKWQSPVWKQVKIVAGAAAVLGALLGMVVLLGGLKG